MIKIEAKHSILKTFFEYIDKVFCSIYKVPDSIIIYYGDREQGTIHIRPSEAYIFFQEDKPIPDNYTWIEWQKTKIPILFHSSNPGLFFYPFAAIALLALSVPLALGIGYGVGRRSVYPPYPAYPQNPAYTGYFSRSGYPYPY